MTTVLFNNLQYPKLISAIKKLNQKHTFVSLLPLAIRYSGDQSSANDVSEVLLWPIRLKKSEISNILR